MTVLKHMSSNNSTNTRLLYSRYFLIQKEPCYFVFINTYQYLKYASLNNY